MIVCNESICPDCGGELKGYDRVKRVVRGQGKHSKWITIRRMRCLECGHIHRELPSYLFPYKQYESEIIKGVLEGIITCETFGYEDYPCEMTMFRWRTQETHLLL